MNDVSGTHEYVAPEVWAKKTNPSCHPTVEAPPVDVFALGRTLFKVMTRKSFFQQEDKNKKQTPLNSKQYSDFIANPEKALQARKLFIPQHVLQLIVGMVQPDPAIRFTLDRIMQDEWFDELNA